VDFRVGFSPLDAEIGSAIGTTMVSEARGTAITIVSSIASALSKVVCTVIWIDLSTSIECCVMKAPAKQNALGVTVWAIREPIGVIGGHRMAVGSTRMNPTSASAAPALPCPGFL
jgi:hypothetical protein